MIETNKQIDINDIVVGGQQGNLLYILDKNSGVQIIEMIDKDNIERNRQIGIIDILGGYKLDQYNDQIVIVL